MAYKDEYEVARLHLDPTERARLEAEFGVGARISYKLHPLALRALGMQRKLTVRPRSGDMTCRMLRRMKRLRGTKLDPFGKAEVRRVERQLPGAYRAIMDQALAANADHDTLVELGELPDMIRGYEDIKLGNVERFHARAAELLEQVGSAPTLRVIQR
jgi:indolepyruvate ferredoxin oxidoreductase